EIGAGGAWLSAELSKQPRVVEVIAMDLSPRLLKEQAPKVFKLLNANAAKIVQVLREAKRVLKPGGQFVAIREPVWPLVKIKSRAKMLAKLVATGVNERFYTLADYKEFFRQAALPLQVKRVNLSTGFKYYVDELVNGLTHARYAFIGVKRGK